MRHKVVKLLIMKLIICVKLYNFSQFSFANYKYILRYRFVKVSLWIDMEINFIQIYITLKSEFYWNIWLKFRLLCIENFFAQLSELKLGRAHLRWTSSSLIIWLRGRAASCSLHDGPYVPEQWGKECAAAHNAANGISKSFLVPSE